MLMLLLGKSVEKQRVGADEVKYTPAQISSVSSFKEVSVILGLQCFVSVSFIAAVGIVSANHNRLSSGCMN